MRTHNGRVSIDGGAEQVGAALTVSAVARRLGVAPATLRTWDRRYGIGPSEHAPGAHRRYTAEDLALLDRMRVLITSGVTPADAARAVRHQPTSVVTDIAPGRQGGGQVIALPGRAPRTRGLARAATSLDAATCSSIIRQSLDERGVIWTWEELILPVIVGIGRQWSATGDGVEVEHLLSAVIQDALAERIRTLPAPANARTVLLACAPEERHSLALWAVGAALAERRIGSRILGASLPASSLEHAVRRLGPAVVLIWAQLPETADPVLPDAVPALRPAATVLVGGPGWPAELPAGVTRVHDLPDTVARITQVLGG